MPSDLRPCVGVDPGQKMSGLTLVDPSGRVAASTHAGCWPTKKRADPIGEAVAHLFEAWDPAWRSPIVCVETPQNGAHASRGGVRVAEGMILSRLHTMLLHRGGLRRPDVAHAEPREWRATGDDGRPKNRDEWKAWAIGRANLYVPDRDITSADEAESILVALYGWATQKGGPAWVG